MTQALRILDTHLAPARWNVAMTAAISERHALGLTGDTVRFHRYPRCVLIGNGQRLAAAADVDYCRRNGIEIARRVTGGGSVYMSPRMLAWDVAIDRQAHAARLEDLTGLICEAVAAGLARLGAAAAFAPPNAIVVAGRRISGSSGTVTGRSAVLQGTVLIEDDLPDMAAALRLPIAELDAGITCLAAALAFAPAMAQVQAAIADGLAQGFDGVPEPAAPDAGLLARAEQLLRDEIGTEDYVSGESASAARAAS